MNFQKFTNNSDRNYLKDLQTSNLKAITFIFDQHHFYPN